MPHNPCNLVRGSRGEGGSQPNGVPRIGITMPELSILRAAHLSHPSLRQVHGTHVKNMNLKTASDDILREICFVSQKTLSVMETSKKFKGIKESVLIKFMCDFIIRAKPLKIGLNWGQERRTASRCRCGRAGPPPRGPTRTLSRPGARPALCPAEFHKVNSPTKL